MKYQTFTVKCAFSFPLDMLRYDSCFPATETDASKILASIENHDGCEVKIGRFVRVKGNNPSVKRWESFSCEISNLEVQ